MITNDDIKISIYMIEQNTQNIQNMMRTKTEISSILLLIDIF